MRYVSLFSGIEAASVAWAPLGWEPMAFSEIEPFPCAVLAERFPDVPNLGDVKEVDWHGFEAAHGRPDVVVGGSPCQSFSVAGTRTGLDGPSGLMREYVRAIRDIRPRWLLWENVPGALSSSHGEDFRCLLESLDALGYGLAWRVLDAQFFGVAQRRERVFLVGRLGDPDGPCEVLFEREGMPWDPPSSREKRQELAAGAGSGAAYAGFCAGNTAGAGSIGYQEELSPTLRGAFTLNTADRHAVVCMSDATSNGAVSGDVCGTLTAHASKNAPMVSQYGDVAGTLTARFDSSPCADRGRTVVAFAQNTRDEVRLVGKDGSIVGALAAEPGMKQTSYVAQEDMSVRRLTPRECERLQGFPDDWTLIPYRGKPAGECPDTPRYKALGNSMAVPVMRWIGERIEEAER